MRKEWTLFFTFLKIGAFTFGGGYAMIALLENEFVERKKWIKKDDFLNMVAIAESCLLYTSPSPRDRTRSRMPSSA